MHRKKEFLARSVAGKRMSQTSMTRNDAEQNWREEEGTENGGQYKIRLNEFDINRM